MTKKENNIYKAYLRAKEKDIRYLYQVYNNYSYNKERALNKIEYEMGELNGKDLYIMGHNSSFFSCGYILVIENKTYLIYHTHTKRLSILLD